MATSAPTASGAPPRERLHIDSLPGRRGLDLRELWTHRELLYFFIWRDLKVKYRQTLLGAVWAVLIPLTQMGIFTILFGVVVGAPTDRIPKPLFYYAALLPWTYFAASLGAASSSLVGNAQFLTRIYMPRLMIPLAPCVSNLVDFLIAFAILIVMVLGYAGGLPLTALLAPLFVAIAIATAFGTGLAFAALQVRYRDVRYVTPFLTQVWMYCTVIVPYSAIQGRFGGWAALYGLNPMAAVVEGMRWCLLHHVATAGGGPAPRMPWELLATGLPVAALLVAGGVYYFRRVEDMFADII